MYGFDKNQDFIKFLKISCKFAHNTKETCYYLSIETNTPKGENKMTLTDYINSNEELRKTLIEDVQRYILTKYSIDHLMWWLRCDILATVDDINNPKLPDGTRVTKKAIREWYKNLTREDIWE